MPRIISTEFNYVFSLSPNKEKLASLLMKYHSFEPMSFVQRDDNYLLYFQFSKETKIKAVAIKYTGLYEVELERLQGIKLLNLYLEGSRKTSYYRPLI